MTYQHQRLFYDFTAYFPLRRSMPGRRTLQTFIVSQKTDSQRDNESIKPPCSHFACTTPTLQMNETRRNREIYITGKTT